MNPSRFGNCCECGEPMPPSIFSFGVDLVCGKCFLKCLDDVPDTACDFSLFKHDNPRRPIKLTSGQLTELAKLIAEE